MNVRPLGDRIIVEPILAETMTPGGIALPDSVKKQGSQRGVVQDVGSGRLLDNGERVPLEIKVGDQVIYKSFAGTEIEIAEITLVVLQESDILAVISE